MVPYFLCKEEYEVKRLIILILCLSLCLSIGAASPATPTDIDELVEIDDDDWGHIDEEYFERQVFISLEKSPNYLGDTAIFVAILINFKPEDLYTIYWQYSENKTEWTNIENEHSNVLEIIIDKNNCLYYWRVCIKMEEVL